MTLEVTKDDKKIEIIIAVMGDISGDGEVTIQDLVSENDALLNIKALENEYMIAGDIDENGEITISDLVTVNDLLLGLL